MTKVEDAIVLECLLEVHSTLSYQGILLRQASDVVIALTAIDATIDKTSALAYSRRQHVREGAKPAIASAAALILSDNFDSVRFYYESTGQISSWQHVLGVLAKRNPTKSDGGPNLTGIYSERIFESWKRKTISGNGLLKSGIYQFFRQYLPPFPNGSVPSDSYDWTDPLNRCVICKLVYVDSRKMECIVITSELSVYIGTMFISRENILSAILQHDTETGIVYRFTSMKLERNLKFYSGLCVKNGDKTRRPLAAQCLYVMIPRSHVDLYMEVTALASGTLPIARIGRNSVIAQYISENPPNAPYDPNDPDWSRVKFVKNFPALAKMVKPEFGSVMFPESFRTMDVKDISSIGQTVALKPFRHDGKLPPPPLHS